MSELQLPPKRAIAAALRFTTERLVSELHEPSATAPDWSEHEWRIARAVAAIHGIAPILATRLTWRGPDSWHAFLEQQREHTWRRHQRIAAVLAQLDAAARIGGVPIVALKGAALHELGIYRPGERPMADIDLLVHPNDMRSARTAIESCCYDFSHETSKHQAFQPRSAEARSCIGEHRDNPILIDLHSSIAEWLPVERCDISELALAPAIAPGVSSYGSKGALMAHLLLHAAGMIVTHRMRAIHLYDVARLSHQMTACDWRDVLALAPAGRLWWSLPPLVLAMRYFPNSVPRFVLEHAESVCAWLLRVQCRRRSLTDVSLSDLRIRAFPGMAWARSVPDACRYMSSRLWPSAEAMAARKQYAKFQSLGAQTTWVRSSQIARVARWLAGQAVRNDTMATVRAAITD